MPDERWLLVSKPLRAPFSDGSNVLVRDLVAHLPASRTLSYFGDPAAPIRPEVGDEVIPKQSMGHAPSLAAKVGVLTSIVSPTRRRQPLHFFFTPNKVTSSVVAGLRRLQPRRRMIQTLMSADRVADHARFLQPLDAVVVLSDHTARALEQAGIDGDRIHTVHPGVPLVAPSEDIAAKRRLLYAGDLDGDVARRLIAIGQALDEPRLEGWTLIIAARPKAHEDARHRSSIDEQLRTQIESGRVELLGEVPDMDALMRSASIQLFVAAHVRKKVDLPLAVLEGLSRGLGLVAIDFAPLNEIFERAQAHDLQPGVTVDPQAPDQQLVDAILKAAGQPELLLRWSKDAHTLVSREFSVERMASRFGELYQHLESKPSESKE